MILSFLFKWTTMLAGSPIRFIFELVFSPTRFIFDILWRLIFRAKTNVSFYYAWSMTFLVVSAATLATSSVRGGIESWPRPLMLLGLWALPFSRIIEVAGAFYKDARDRLARRPKGTPKLARLELLAVSYIEIAVEFSILYISLPSAEFANAITSPMDAFYFSWATITTTGYGDITPKLTLSRALSMLEVAIGLMMLVFAVGAYLSSEVASTHEPSK